MDKFDNFLFVLLMFFCLVFTVVSLRNFNDKVEEKRSETEITCTVVSVNKESKWNYTSYQTIVLYDDEIYTINDKGTYFLYKDCIGIETPALLVENWTPLGNYHTIELPNTLTKWE